MSWSQISMPTNTQWKDYVSCVEPGVAAGGVLCGWSWLHTGVLQEPALSVSWSHFGLLRKNAPVSRSVVLLETPELQTSGGRGASAHWNQHVPGCTALNENYCRSQWFDADLILCMITENDVSENGHQGYGMCCYGKAPDDKVKYVYRHRDMYYS